jgi:hypothetical protein
MRASARGQGIDKQKVLGWLNPTEPRLRLLGLTFARAEGTNEHFAGVLDKITHSLSAFEQYQALLAMEGLV